MPQSDKSDGTLTFLYDWLFRLIRHRGSIIVLGVLAFAESIVFPIPIDVMLVPAMLAHPARAFLVALFATCCSVLGGMVGWAVGSYLFQSWGGDLVAWLGVVDAVESFQLVYHRYGWWIVLGGAFTPFPYKVTAIASGVAGLDGLIFFTASLIGRGGRFFLLAWLAYTFGDAVTSWLRSRLGWGLLGLFLLAGGVVLLFLGWVGRA